MFLDLTTLRRIAATSPVLAKDVAVVIAAMTTSQAVKASAYRLEAYRKRVLRDARALLDPQLHYEHQRMLERLVEVCDDLEEPLGLLLHYDQVQQDRLLLQQLHRSWGIYRNAVQPWSRTLSGMGVTKLDDFDKEFRSFLSDLE